MSFIKISLNENFDQIINIDVIQQIIKGEDLQLIGDQNHEKFISVPSYTLVIKNCGPIKITKDIYEQITEKIKGFIL